MSDRDTIEKIINNADHRLLGYEAATVDLYVRTVDRLGEELGRVQALYQRELNRPR